MTNVTQLRRSLSRGSRVGSYYQGAFTVGATKLMAIRLSSGALDISYEIENETYEKVMRTFVVINNEIIREFELNLSNNYIKIDLDLSVPRLNDVSIYEITGGIDEIL